jgi:hypothetical protein
MHNIEISDPVFRDAVKAIDSGDETALKKLLDTNPRLLTDRLNAPKGGYFQHPYLLWFVAENPVRNDTLPKNIIDIARLIIESAKQQNVGSLSDQINYTLALVCSGRVSREQNSQIGLIDLLVEYGANPNGPLMGALTHQETEALKRLLHHGATLTLPVAVGLKLKEEIPTLLKTASRADLQSTLTAAAYYGDANTLKTLLEYDLDINAWNTEGFHTHSVPLHQAVWAGSVDAVKMLADAGADLRIKDKIYHASPLSWAIHCEKPEIEKYLRERIASQIAGDLVRQGIIKEKDLAKTIQRIAPELVT